MTARSRTGCEKWPNVHRGAFRPPSGGGSLRGRPPAPFASRRFEPVRSCCSVTDWRSSSDVNARARSSEGARGSRLFFRELACLSPVRERLLARLTWEKRNATRVRGARMKKTTRRKRQLRQPNSPCQEENETMSSLSWMKEAREVTVSSSKRVICELEKPSQLKLVSLLISLENINH